MSAVHLILVGLALLCFLFGAAGVSAPRGNLLALGLFLWLLATLVAR